MPGPNQPCSMAWRTRKKPPSASATPPTQTVHWVPRRSSNPISGCAGCEGGGGGGGGVIGGTDAAAAARGGGTGSAGVTGSAGAAGSGGRGGSASTGGLSTCGVSGSVMSGRGGGAGGSTSAVVCCVAASGCDRAAAAAVAAGRLSWNVSNFVSRARTRSRAPTAITSPTMAIIGNDSNSSAKNTNSMMKSPAACPRADAMPKPIRAEVGCAEFSIGSTGLDVFLVMTRAAVSGGLGAHPCARWGCEFDCRPRANLSGLDTILAATPGRGSRPHNDQIRTTSQPNLFSIGEEG